MKVKFQENHAHYGGDYGGDGDDGDDGGDGDGGDGQVEGQGKVTERSHHCWCHEGSVARWMIVEPA